MGRRLRAAALAVALVTVGFVAAAPRASAASCTGAADKPAIGELMVNQGIPSYGKIIRGKKALIKLFMTLPSACTSTSKMFVTGATLTLSHVTLDGTTVDPVSLQLTPTATLSGGPIVAAAQDNAKWDPIFAVPASFLAPPATSSVDWTKDWTLRINASVTYKITSTGTPTTVAPYLNGSTLPAARTVEHKTNAFRVLVVPLGDTTQTYTSQFPAAARTALDNGMSAFARMGPFPDGTNTLNSNANGLRYSVDPGMLNIGPTGLNLLDATGKWCGSATKWNLLQGPLTSWLNSYNAANPNFPADRVLGVISSAISFGSSSSPPCDEGRASVPTSTTTAVGAWVRAVPDTQTVKSLTGPVLTMELMHTIGACYDDGTNRCPGTYHSTSATADVTSPHRAYNLTQASYVAANQTVMRLGLSGYDNNTTFMERDDFALMACMLGGDTTRADGSAVPGCTGTVRGSLGTTSGVPAGPTFVLSGSTDGTGGDTSPCVAPGRIADGTSINESFFRDLQEPGGYPISPDEPSSAYRLLQINAGGTVLDDRGLPTSVSTQSHGSTDSAPVVTTLGIAVPFNADAQLVELVHRVSGQDKILYCRTRTLAPSTPTPSVPETGSKFVYTGGSGVGNYDVYISPGDAVGTGLLCTDIGTCGAFGTRLTTTQDSLGPALSPDGTKILFQKFRGGIWLMNADGTGQTELANSDSSSGDYNPIWSPDGHTFAYVRGSDYGLVVRDIDKVHPNQRVLATSTPINTMAFSPDGRTIVWGVGDNLRDIVAAPTSGTGVPQMVITGDGLAPLVAPDRVNGVGAIAWSPFNENLLAVAVEGDGGEGAIGLVDVSTGVAVKLAGGLTSTISGVNWTPSGTRLIASELLPSAADFSLLSLPVDGLEAPQPVLSAAGFTTLNPSFANLAAPPDETVTTSDDYPDETTASFFFTCGNGLQFPIAVGLHPTDTTDETVSFENTFDPSVSCGSGDPEIVGYVADGFSQTRIDTIPATPAVEGIPVAASDPKAPTAAIDAPIDGATYDATASFPLHGTGTDAEDGDLCQGPPETGTQPPCGLSWTLTHNGVTVTVASGTDTTFVRSGDAAIPASFRDAPTGLWAGGDYTITLVGSDGDGNHASNTATIHVLPPGPLTDTTPPTVTITGVVNGAHYALGTVPHPGCTTVDNPGGTGVQTPAHLVGPTGGNSNGTGVFAVSCAGGADNAGNVAAPVTATYQVTFTTSNNPAVLLPIKADNSSVFLRQLPILVRFRLDGDPRGGFTTKNWKLQAAAVNCKTSALTGELTTVKSFIGLKSPLYIPLLDEYDFDANLSAKKAGTCWRFLVTLDDGAGAFANTSFYSPIFKLV